eukprot:1151767-Pelagomonas_calceolata.AAC.3
MICLQVCPVQLAQVIADCKASRASVVGRSEQTLCAGAHGGRVTARGGRQHSPREQGVGQMLHGQWTRRHCHQGVAQMLPSTGHMQTLPSGDVLSGKHQAVADSTAHTNSGVKQLQWEQSAASTAWVKSRALDKCKQAGAVLKVKSIH